MILFLLSGHTINRLSKHESKEVSDLAKSIVKKWSEFFEEKKDKPMIEVKCDRQTEGMRNTARKHLAGALGVTVSQLLATIKKR